MSGTNPLPNPPVAWSDLKTGQPTQAFYQYIFQLDAIVAGAVAGVALNGLKLLNTLVASSSASLDDTADITATYDLYMIELVDFLPATNGDLLLLQYQISAAFQTTNYSTLLAGGFTPGFGSSASADGGANVNGIYLGPNGGANFNAIDNTKSGLSGMIWLHSPSSGTHKKTTGSVTWESAGANNIQTATVGGTYTGGNGVVTGLRFKFNAGNIASGKVKIYGVKT